MRSSVVLLLAVLTVGLGSETARAQEVTIRIDATALTTRGLQLKNDNLSPRQEMDFPGAAFGAPYVGTFTVTPNPYWFVTYYPDASPYPRLYFSVSAAGTVDYSSTLDWFVSGRGTSTLVLHGIPMQIDATDLSYSQGFFRGLTGSTNIDSVVSFRLLPGGHRMRFTSGVSPLPGFTFNVSADGTITPQAVYQHLLIVNGSTLTVHGVPVTIDATRLSVSQWSWQGFKTFNTRPDITSVKVFPGLGDLMLLTSPYPYYATVTIRVRPDGTIAYDEDPSINPVTLEGILSGQGTPHLVMNGVEVSIDARFMGVSQIHMDRIGFRSTSEIIPLVTLPGRHRITSSAPSPLGNILYFVTAGATVDYDLALDPYLCGRGTDTLIIGVPNASCDSDGDGLKDVDELALGTDRFNPDTDGDGLMDGTEVDLRAGGSCPDPLNPDSDGDGLSDGQEVSLGTNPCSPDTDGDGVPDRIDPLPLDPGVTPDFLVGMLRQEAVLIRGLDLGLFNGPNANANRGRRNSLANRAEEAAAAITAGNPGAAVGALSSLLEKIDGQDPPPDWMFNGDAKTALAADVRLMRALAELL